MAKITNELIKEIIALDETSVDKLKSYFRDRSVQLIYWLRENPDDQKLEPAEVFDKFNN